jgi:8-oxo-dGTP pyrophosphatase MutT (NUDIX family)
VDQGEGFPQAVRREIAEETGLRQTEIDFVVDTVHFYRGDARPENELVGVCFCCTTDQPDAIRFSAEHTEHHWLTPDEIATHLPEGHWLVDLIQRAERIRQLMPQELLAVYQNTYRARS